MSGLFSSKTKSSSTSSTQVPQNYQNFLNQSLQKASEASSAPFVQYQGQRIADLSGNEQMGIQGAANNYGMYQPLVDMATMSSADLATKAGRAPTSGEMGQFINPYVDYVLGNSLDRLQEQSDINMTKIGSQAGMSGAFGGLRHGVLEGANLAELLKSARDLSGTTYSDAYDKGMGNWWKSQDSQRASIDTLLGTARSGQAYNQGDISQLMQTGLTERTRNQGLLDFNFGEFMREQEDPLTKASFMSSIAAQYPRDIFTKTTKSESTTTDSPMKTLAGIGMAVAGVMSGNPAAAMSLGAGSGSLGRAWGPAQQAEAILAGDGKRAKGGLIKGYKKGGTVKKDPLAAISPEVLKEVADSWTLGNMSYYAENAPTRADYLKRLIANQQHAQRRLGNYELGDLRNFTGKSAADGNASQEEYMRQILRGQALIDDFNKPGPKDSMEVVRQGSRSGDRYNRPDLQNQDKFLSMALSDMSPEDLNKYLEHIGKYGTPVDAPEYIFRLEPDYLWDALEGTKFPSKAYEYWQDSPQKVVTALSRRKAKERKYTNPSKFAEGGFLDGIRSWGANRDMDMVKAGLSIAGGGDPLEALDAYEQNQRYIQGYAKGGKVKSPAWQRSEGKNPEGGLNAKGRASYNRQTGGNLKAPQPEGGSRRDSFCARMGGMKKKLTSSKTANDPDSRINKALRKWKCADGGLIKGYAGGGRIGPGNPKGLNIPAPDESDRALEYFLRSFEPSPATGFESNMDEATFLRREMERERVEKEQQRLARYNEAGRKNKDIRQKMETTPLGNKGNPLDAAIRSLEMNMPEAPFIPAEGEPAPINEQELVDYMKQLEISKALGNPGKTLRLNERMPKVFLDESTFQPLLRKDPGRNLSKPEPAARPYQRSPDDFEREERRKQLEEFIEQNKKSPNLDFKRKYAEGGKVEGYFLGGLLANRDPMNYEAMGFSPKGIEFANILMRGRRGRQEPLARAMPVQQQFNWDRFNQSRAMNGQLSNLTGNMQPNPAMGQRPDLSGYMTAMQSRMQPTPAMAGGGYVKKYQEGGSVFTQGGRSFEKSQDRVPAEMIDPLAALYHGMDTSAGKFRPDFQNLGREDILSSVTGNPNYGEGTITKAQARGQAPRFESMNDVIDSLPVDPNTEVRSFNRTPMPAYTKSRMWDDVNEDLFLEGTKMNEQDNRIKNKLLSTNPVTQAFSQYQFTPGTWNEAVAKLSPEVRKRFNINPVSRKEIRKYESGDVRLADILPSQEAVDYVYKTDYLPIAYKNLKAAGLPITEINLYLAHHIGREGAPKAIPALYDPANADKPMIEIFRELGMKKTADNGGNDWNKNPKLTFAQYRKKKEKAYKDLRSKYAGKTLKEMIGEVPPNDPSRGGETIDGGTTTFNPVKIIKGGRGFADGSVGKGPIMRDSKGNVIPQSKQTRESHWSDRLHEIFATPSGDTIGNVNDWIARQAGFGESNRGKVPTEYPIIMPVKLRSPLEQTQPSVPKGAFSGPNFFDSTSDDVAAYYNELGDMTGADPLNAALAQGEPSAPMADALSRGIEGDARSVAQDEDEVMLKQMMRDRILAMKDDKGPEQPTLFGLNVNMDLVKLGLGMLASDKNFGGALGESGMNLIQSKEQEALRKSKENSQKLQELLDLRYKNAMMESMDPEVKAELARQKAASDMQLERLKQKNKLDELQIKSSSDLSRGIALDNIKRIQDKIALGEVPLTEAEKSTLWAHGIEYQEPIKPGSWFDLD